MTGAGREAAPRGAGRTASRVSRRLLPALLLAPALVLTLVTATATPAAPATTAQAAGQASPTVLVDMVLTRVDAVVTDDEEDVVVVARVRNPGPVPLTDVRGTLSVHPRVTSRFALHRALDDEARPASRVRGVVERPLPDLAADDTRFLAFEASPAELGLAAGTSEPAVHPAVVELRGRQADGRTSTLASVTTALVVADPAPARPLLAALLLPLDTDVTARAARTEITGFVRSATEVLEDSGVPVAVAVDNAIARAGDLRDPDDVPEPAFTEAVRGLLELPHVERLAVPYAEADLSALHRGDLDALARLQLRLGRRPWPGTLDTPVSGIVVPAAGLADATLEAVLAPRGVDTVVLDRDQLTIDEAAEPPTSPSPVRPLAASTAGDGFTVLVPDPWLRDLLSRRPELAPLDVHRIVAETALLHLERPGAEEQRGVLLAPRDAVALSPQGMGALLEALDRAPWADVTTVAALRDGVAAGPPAPLAHGSVAQAAELAPEYVADIAAAEETLDALRLVLAPDSPQLQSLRDNVLRATSTDYRDNLAAGRALLSTVTTTGTELLGSVEVIGRPTITFTDATGQLPVVLRNTAAVPLTVRVQLSSSRLRFPGGDQDVRLGADATTTVLFDAEARTPGGTAPVDVRVTDPGATTELATGTVVVRIAAYPLLALLLIGGAAAAIVLWWVRDLRIRRRGDHERTGATAAHVDAA